MNKPAGSGKSIVLQIAPFVEMELASVAEDESWRTKAILIVISPLVSLMKDQVKQLESWGISAAYVAAEQTESVLEKIEEGHYNLVFMSPSQLWTTIDGGP